MAYTNIDRSSDYFRIKTYSGNGTNNTNITFDESTNMQPDFVWIKNRSQGAVGGYHRICDVIRGAGYEIFTNDTLAESYSNNVLKAFQTNGFQLGTDSAVNNASYTYVSWNFKANGAGVSNTSGTITSTVSANTTSGFSIVSYTGTGATATVGHGLNAVPSMVIVKSRSNPPADHWFVYHKSTGNTGSTYLNLTSAFATGANDWNNTTPTSSVFSIGTQSGINYNGGTFIAYCFAEVKGYSKAFSYTGNGSSDGTFVYCGFRPAMVIRKRTDAVQDWLIHDNKRTGINQTSNYTSTLKPNTSDAEYLYNEIDILSNGFKMRDTGTHGNASGGTYIGFAVAESPFVSSKGLPCTAR